MSVKCRKILKSDFIEFWACLPFSAIIASIYLAGSFKRQSKGNWIDFVGNIYIKLTYEHYNICHASMRTKSRLNPLLKCRLNNKPKLWKNNTKILKCQTKRKKGKKNSKLFFIQATRRNIHSCGNAKQRNLLFNYSFFETTVIVLLPCSIQCPKTYPKSQYSNRKALNLILDHQRM